MSRAGPILSVKSKEGMKPLSEIARQRQEAQMRTFREPSAASVADRPQCTRPGCSRKIQRNNESGLCAKCFYGAKKRTNLKRGRLP